MMALIRMNSSKCEMFKMHAALMRTISDYPGLGIYVDGIFIPDVLVNIATMSLNLVICLIDGNGTLWAINAFLMVAIKSE